MSNHKEIATEKAIELLRTTKELINNEENWAKGVYARTKSGVSVPILDPAAECFCWVGARLKAEDLVVGFDRSASYIFDNAVKASLVSMEKLPDVIRFNDHVSTKHADVMQMAEGAIKILGGS